MPPLTHRRSRAVRILAPGKDSSLADAATGAGIYLVLAVGFAIAAALTGEHNRRIIFVVVAVAWAGTAISRLLRYRRVRSTLPVEGATGAAVPPPRPTEAMQRKARKPRQR